MARYPERHSAVIPALHAAQQLHGWCSPEAIDQVAAVMRVTPAYLTSVATFYDMLETEPEPTGHHDVYVCTNISCSLRGADEFYEAMIAAAAGHPEVHVRAFECLGACDIAPMASVDGEYVGPLEDEDAGGSSRTSTPGGRCSRPSSCGTASAPTRRSPRSATQPHEAAVRPHRRARAQHARGLRAPRRLPVAAQGADDAARGRCSTSSTTRASAAAAAPDSGWARRRRSCPRGRHGEVPGLQRRRVRAGHVQGPRADAEEPAHADRGDRDRLVGGGDRPRVHLHPRRVRRTRPTSSTPRSRRRTRPATSANGSSAASTPARSCCTAAPAPTSAARRRGCSTRSRASAATRG